MAQLKKKKAASITPPPPPPQLDSITFGLDTSQFAPSFLVLEVTNVNANNTVNISRDANTTWAGILKKPLTGNLWLAEVKFTGTPSQTFKVFDLETLTVTVTSGANTSNEALVDANVYNSDN